MIMKAAAHTTHTMTLDGNEVEFTDGETIYQVAKRHQKNIPTLCYDDRLEPFGGCRMCVVDVEGQRAPVASCTMKATPGMVCVLEPIRSIPTVALSSR